MTIETTAKTVELATEKALKELGLDASQVTIEVLDNGGMLRKARVKATAIEATPEDTTNLGKATKFLTDVINLMGFNGFTVEGTENENNITLNVVSTSEEDGNIIGYRGETLDSLQYLTSLIINEKQGQYNRLVVDSEGYRAKREQILIKLAHNLERKVRRTNQPVKLEHMNPYERRIIHTTLQNSDHVSTESDGVGNHRHIIISPKLVSDILNIPTNRTKPTKFVYSSDKKRRR